MNLEYSLKPELNLKEIQEDAQRITALLRPGMTSLDALAVFAAIEKIKANLQTTMAYLRYQRKDNE